MNRRFLLSTSCLIAAMSVYATGSDPVTIAWKPKEGAVYKFTVKFMANVAGQDFAFTSDNAETIKSVKPDHTVVLEDKATNIVVMVAGNKVDSPGTPDSQTDTVTESGDGHVLDRKSDAAQKMPRLDSLSQFIYPSKPVNVGDTWTLLGKGDKAAGTVDYEVDYTYRGTDTQDGISSYKIDVAMKETAGANPMTGAGTVWIDTDTGELVKISAKIKNIESPAGTLDGEIAQDRKS